MWIQTIFFPFRNTLLSFYFQVFYSPLASCSSFLIQFHNGANYANTALSIIIRVGERGKSTYFVVDNEMANL